MCRPVLKPFLLPYWLVSNSISYDFFWDGSGIISIIRRRRDIGKKAGLAVLLDYFEEAERKVRLVVEVKIVGGLG